MGRTINILLCLGVTCTYGISLFPLTKSINIIPIFLLVYILCLWAILFVVTCILRTFSSHSIMKAVLRQGIACSCDKNTNLVAHFIGSIYRVCICGYYNVFAGHC